MESDFESLFQAFVERGGLDETQALGEDFERSMRAARDPASMAKMLEKCKHGLTYLTCSQCYLYFNKG